MTEHFCTYFDHRYAVKGLAMWRSLEQHRRGAVLHVLCLSDACREILDSLTLPNVHLYRLSDLERADPDLLVARMNRSLIEYYFTLTPCAPLYLLATRTDIPRVTYIDADLYFFADPVPIFDEIGDKSIGLVEHRFPESLAQLNAYGRFNVGWLTFTNDENSLTLLRRWRQQCLHWCHDRLEDDRFAEQKYLDDWPSQCESVAVIQHKGANVAPWNLGRHELVAGDDGLRVGDDPLLFFHAHGFEPASPAKARDLNLRKYGVVETPLIVQRIYDPYDQSLLATTRELAVPLALALAADSSRDTVSRIESLENRIARLEDDLTTSESDRAARLKLIHALQQQLDASEADRAARLDLIHDLQRKIDARQRSLETTRTRLQQATDRITLLQNSRSWRWTRPLRSVLTSLRRRDA